MDKVKAAVQASVTSQTEGLRTTFKQIDTVGNQKQPARDHEGPLPLPEVAPKSSAMAATKALPPPVPEPALDATEFKVRADNEMTPLEVNPAVLALARSEKDHPMAALATSRDVVETGADSAGTTARTTEGQVLGEAKDTLNANEGTARAGMHGARKGRLGKVQDQMGTRKKGAESEHKTFADKVRDVYIKAKGAVNLKLGSLTKVVGTDFDTAQKGYLKTFKDGIDRDMRAFKKDRYNHWYSGVTKAYDWMRGLSRMDRVKDFYAANKKTYIANVNGLIKRTNATINTTITSCKTILTQAKTDVKTQFDNLSTKEKAGAKATLDGVLKQLKSLEGRVSAREATLKKKVEGKRTSAIDNMEAELERIKKANQGFVNDVADGVKAVANALAQFAKLVSRVSSRGVTTYIGDLLGQAKDAINNYLWKAIVVEFKDWLTSKLTPLTAVLALPKNYKEILSSAGDTLLSFFLEVLPSAMKAVVKAFLSWFGTQALRKLIPGIGSVGMIIDGLKAAWAFVKRVLAAAGQFFKFIMEVGLAKKVPQMLAGAIAKLLIGALDAVLVFFGVNKLIRKLGGAIAGPFRKKFGPLARRFRRDKKKKAREARRARRQGRRTKRRGGKRRRADGRKQEEQTAKRRSGNHKRPSRAARNRERLEAAGRKLRPNLRKFLGRKRSSVSLFVRLRLWRARYRLRSLTIKQQGGRSAIVARVNPEKEVAAVEELEVAAEVKKAEGRPAKFLFRGDDEYTKGAPIGTAVTPETLEPTAKELVLHVMPKGQGHSQGAGGRDGGRRSARGHDSHSRDFRKRGRQDRSSQRGRRGGREPIRHTSHSDAIDTALETKNLTEPPRSRLVSFSELHIHAKSFTKKDKISKVLYTEIERLHKEGRIRIYRPDDVFEILGKSKKYSNIRGDVKAAMEKNKEILIMGQVPESLVEMAKP